MDTKCQVCYQAATKKCTGCGQVFCDLHVRYGGQAGGMYGTPGAMVGYYCDECWEKKVIGRQRLVKVLVGVGVLLLAVNMLGFMAFQGSVSLPVGPVAIAVVVLGLLFLVGAIVMKSRR